MPRRDSHAQLAHDFLKKRPGGATLPEIRAAVGSKRGSEVLPHSIRSAIYQHLDQNGEKLFVKVGRAKYALRS